MLWLRISLLACLLAGAIAFAVWQEVRWYLRSPDFARDVAGQIAENMQAPVTLESVELPSPDRAILRGLFVRSPRQAGTPAASPALIAVPEIDVVFAGRPDWDRDVELASLRILNPRIWFDEAAFGGIAWPPYTPRLPAEASPRLSAAKVVVTGANVVLVDRTGVPALDLESADVEGTFTSRRGVLTGDGRVRAQTVQVASKIILSQWQAKLVCGETSSRLAEMEAAIYGGALAGALVVRQASNACPMELEIHIRDLDSRACLEALGLASALDLGPISVDFAGSGDLFHPLQAQLAGSFETGKVDASKIPVLARLEKMARDTGLAAVSFTKMRGTFETRNGRVYLKESTTLPEGQTRVFASGWADFDGRIDFRGTIHVGGGLLGGIEGLLRDLGLKKSASALVQVPFRVTGTMAAPKVELNPSES